MHDNGRMEEIGEEADLLQAPFLQGENKSWTTQLQLCDWGRWVFVCVGGAGLPLVFSPVKGKTWEEAEYPGGAKELSCCKQNSSLVLIKLST